MTGCISKLLEVLVGLSQRIFSPFLFRNVRVCTEPAECLSAMVLNRRHAGEKRTEYTIDAPQRENHFDRRTVLNSLSPLTLDRWQLFWIVNRFPSPTLHLFECCAGVIVPA